MPVLLGQIPARAQPAAPGHDHGCDALKPRPNAIIRVEHMAATVAAEAQTRILPSRSAAFDQNGDFCSAALAHLPRLAKLYAAGE
jgi:hypothetical protein